ncbi:family 2 encapsulin nanocompartment cargo protein polyprenyl transferase [Rhodococcus erythropolis]|uniref:family 2 encapsulin nanocompartment cargo protein polyprenyl transferase n=1 Tax=Rhodococcus erythropolis TaxID=1833 RepID=UPI00294974A7|nr:family 2 encapsulin nanocompartment cargo protein polyprenyl transferase [Rhodococcus erythropolis]MDV6278305.1 family 2 encapsulin nanocompartment cargo protein polyprenyl transferase [Rhodococcus erythropolis]
MNNHRSANEILDNARKSVDPALRAAVDQLPSPIRTIAGYHFGWLDRQGGPDCASSGKMLRPALVIAACKAAGGRAESSMDAAVAVELVHNFSLLHDDVMDADATRRHRPTVWSIFGVSNAILVGDAMLALAGKVLADNPIPEATRAVSWLNSDMLALCAGQYADLAFEQRSDVDLDECVAMARGKTGALVGCCCAMGALFAGANSTTIDQFRTFGMELGLAFQLVDDLLGIWGDSTVTGKPVRADILIRKKSLPVVAALTSDTAAARELAHIYRDPAPFDDMRVTRVAELIDAAGGRTWARSEAENHLDIGVKSLMAGNPTAAGAADLLALADLVIRRDY